MPQFAYNPSAAIRNQSQLSRHCSFHLLGEAKPASSRIMSGATITESRPLHRRWEQVSNTINETALTGARGPLMSSQLNQSTNSSQFEITDSPGEDIIPDSTFSEATVPPSEEPTPASSVSTQEGQDSVAVPCHSQEEHILPTIAKQPSQLHTSIASKLSRFLSSKKDLTDTIEAQKDVTDTINEGRVVPIPSRDKIYAFRGVPGLYVAYEDQISAPPELVEKWKTITEPRLWTDIFAFQDKIAKTRDGRRYPPGIALELRMSGRTSSPSDTEVKLLPRIWILYDHDRWAKKIRKFVHESEWLQDEGFGEVEVRKGSPRLATLDPQMAVEGLELDPQKGFPIGPKAILHLHLERRACSSAVGLLCYATITKDGKIWNHRISRVGGLLSIDPGETFLALTTAHGIRELAWDAILDEASDPEDFSDEDEASSDTGYESDDDEYVDDVEDTSWSQSLPSPTATPDLAEVGGWDSVEILGMTSFLGTASLDLTMNASNPQQGSAPSAAFESSQTPNSRQGTDFSLWRIPRSNMMRNGYYYEDSRGRSEVPIELGEPHFFRDLNSSGQSLLILLSHELQVTAFPLPGTSHFMVHGHRLTCQKVRTATIIGSGCSGSWVVRGAFLVGMVIASYEYEPYAHVITYDKVVEDIRSAVPQATGVEVKPVVSPSFSHADSMPKPGNIPSVTPTVQSINNAAKAVFEIIQQRKGQFRPRVPLNMTANTFSTLKDKLAKSSTAYEKVLKTVHVWYCISNDSIRTGELIDFYLHLIDQYENGNPKGTLKQYPSITLDKLDNGYSLAQGLVTDLARAFPNFLKPRSGLQASKDLMNRDEPVGSSPKPLAVVRGNKRPRLEDHDSPVGNTAPRPSRALSTSHKYKPPSPPEDSFPPPEMTSEPSTPVISQRQVISGSQAERLPPPQTTSQPTLPFVARRLPVESPTCSNNTPVKAMDSDLGPLCKKARSETQQTSSHAPQPPTASFTAAKPPTLSMHKQTHAEPGEQSQWLDVPQMVSDPWANSSIDPQTLFAMFAPLETLPGSFASDMAMYRSLTPNDTPESSRDSGVSEPNTDISEGMNLDIDFSWHSINDERLMNMNELNNFGMEGFEEGDMMIANNGSRLSSFGDLNPCFSKPFQFDNALYTMDPGDNNQYRIDSNTPSGSSAAKK